MLRVRHLLQRMVKRGVVAVRRLLLWLRLRLLRLPRLLRLCLRLLTGICKLVAWVLLRVEIG